MAITFNEVPATRRRPGALAEIRANLTRRNLPVFPFSILVVGQKLSTGSAPANAPIRVSSVADAVAYFGRGSMLHRMFDALKRNNTSTTCYGFPLDDNAAGVLAAGSIVIAGTATASGTLSVYIAGQRVQIAVAIGDTASALATALRTAIGNLSDMPITVGGTAGTVALTARHKGASGNDIDLRLNYYGLPDEATPAGLTATVTAMASGATNPDLAAAFATLSDTQRYDVVVMPYNDSASLAAIKAELDDRWTANKSLDGIAILAKSGTYSANTTFTDGLNHKRLSVLPYTGSPTPPWEVASMVAGQVAFSAENDPATPLADLSLLGMLPPVEASRYIDSEREGLLYAGGSTFIVGQDGICRTEYLITTYQTNLSGLDDTSWLDLEDLYIDSYVRRVINFRASEFRRYKLADNGYPTQGGQTVMTPRLFEGHLAVIADQLYGAAIIDSVETITKVELYAERDGSNTSRLNYYFPYKRMGQLRLIAGVIAFEG